MLQLHLINWAHEMLAICFSAVQIAERHEHDHRGFDGRTSAVMHARKCYTEAFRAIQGLMNPDVAFKQVWEKSHAVAKAAALAVTCSEAVKKGTMESLQEDFTEVHTWMLAKSGDVS